VDLILQMMEKEPEKRPQTPTELLERVESCLQELSARRAVDVVHNYQVDQKLADYPIGKYYRGLDVDRRDTVGLLILSEEFVADSVRLAHLEQVVERVRSSPHLGLRRILEFRTNAGQTMLVEEFIIAPSLRDVLRAQGPLSPAAVVAVVKQLAPVVVHASAHRLENVNLTLCGVQLIDSAQTSGAAELMVWAKKPLTQWPQLSLRVAPIDFDFPGQRADLSWAGGVTLAPSITSQPRASYVQRLALLAYELLDGPRATLDSQGRYVPIPALSEEGNRVLRRATADDVGTAQDFADSLAESVGASRGIPSDMLVQNSPQQDPSFEKQEETKPWWRSKLARWGTVLTAAGICAYGFSHSSFRQHNVRNSIDKVPRLSPPPKTTATPDPFDQEWAEVNQFSSTGAWQSALTSCVGLVERYPTRDQPRQKLTTLLEEVQNNPDGITDENFSLVKPALERAGRLGFTPAMFLLAQHLQAKDPDAALTWYEQLAARGNRGAMVQAGLLYRIHDNPEDNRKAFDYFIKAAAAGDPAGMFYAGDCLYYPKAGLLGDEEKALKYL
jgi:hypothetical protein